MLTNDVLIKILHEKFQLQQFRPGQVEVIQSLLAGADVSCVMPIGYGKSLCYQLAALMLDGITVVVWPLVALMKDQVDSLWAKGFREVTFINSSVTLEEQRVRLQVMKTGRFKLGYLKRRAKGHFVLHRYLESAFSSALMSLGISAVIVIFSSVTG